jgi:hypothetical protein
VKGSLPTFANRGHRRVKTTLRIQFSWLNVVLILTTVSKLLRALTVAMLVLYGLALSHCTLEQLPGFAFLACCDHQDSAPHQDNACEQDACSVVESGFYKISDHDDVAPAPLLLLSNVPLELQSSALDEPSNATICAPAPAELPHTWQFCFRTALPPRAPSFAS